MRIRNIASTAILGLMVASCAKPDANIYGGLAGQRVVGNDQYVTVSNVWNEMDALPLATLHCKQYGKSPRLTGYGGARAVFDCR